MNRVEGPAVDADLSQIKTRRARRPRNFRFSRSTTPSRFERMESDSTGQLLVQHLRRNHKCGRGLSVTIVGCSDFPVAAVYDRRIEKRRGTEAPPTFLQFHFPL